MILYQLDNSSNEKNNDIRIYDDLYYVPHLHRDFEFVYVIEGSVNATVEGVKYAINAGQILMVLSNQIHSYTAEHKNRAVVHVFSADNVPSFSRTVAGKYCVSPVFDCDPDAAVFYLKCCIEKNNRTPLSYKAYLYAICDQFLQNCSLSDGKESGQEILHRMLSYISENYKEDITLEKLSAELGYESHYLSRVFGRSVGMNLRQYINQYRVDHAKYLIVDTDESITDIALSCGFQSIRNFNRVFCRLTGMTPQELRKKGNQ